MGRLGLQRRPASMVGIVGSGCSADDRKCGVNPVNLTAGNQAARHRGPLLRKYLSRLPLREVGTREVGTAALRAVAGGGLVAYGDEMLEELPDGAVCAGRVDPSRPITGYVECELAASIRQVARSSIRSQDVCHLERQRFGHKVKRGPAGGWVLEIGVSSTV